MADFIDALEAKTARLLADADHLGYFALQVKDRPAGDPKRAEAAVQRARRIHEAITAAGVKLPLSRAPGENPEQSMPATEDLTVSQIAALAAVNRTTVQRWILQIGGAIGEKYAEARRKGAPAIFTRAEAFDIMRGCKWPRR